jgi:hypothetical protein
MDSASAAEPPSRTKEAKSRVEVTWAVKPSPLRPPGSLPSQAPVRIKKSMTGSAKSAPFQTAKPCRLERRCGGVYDSGAGDSTIAPDFIKWVCPLARSPDGRCLLVSLPLGPFPFESMHGPIVIERLIFSTTGISQIKYLRSRLVFGLPLLGIRGAKNPAASEGVIRRA